METEMNFEKIHELAEKYDFNALSDNNKEIVLSHMTREEYLGYRQTVVSSVSLFSEANQYKPKPLIIPVTTHFLATPIPLYKALIGIAAMALLMLMVFPLQNMAFSKQKIKYVTLYDTLEKEVIHFDTVEKIVERPTIREKIVYVNNDQQLGNKEAPRLLDVPRQNQDLSFSKKTIQNKGTSMRDDTLLFALPRIF